MHYGWAGHPRFPPPPNTPIESNEGIAPAGKARETHGFFKRGPSNSGGGRDVVIGSGEDR
jgi:hypothetical protein